MLLELATRAARRKLEWGVLLSTKAMWRSRISMTELAFLVCGLLIICVGWTADFLGVFEFASSPGGHGSGTTFALRLFMTMFGVSFASIGVGVAKEVEPLGVVSKLVEVLTILVLVSLMQAERPARRPSVEASAVPNR